MTTTSLVRPPADPPVRVPVRVLDGARCHLGEGPAYDAARDTAFWFDILERRLHEADLAAGTVRVHALPVMASALALVDDTRQLIAAEDGLHLRDIASGRMERIAAIEADDAATRSNDARVHPSGTFWTSTMGKRAEKGAGSLYAFREGRVDRLFGGLTIPNAICFSPDGAIGYFADTAANMLMRVPLDPATGLPSGEPAPVHRHSGEGGLDGAVTDAEGLIWCAIWGGAAIHVISPGGALVRRIAVPVRQPSCPVFAGPRFDKLLVTSAYEGMGAVLRAADPDHGRTFLLEPGALGGAEPCVRLGGGR